MHDNPIHSFAKFPTYTDPGAVNQLCRDILNRGAGEAAQLQIGTCRITGPGQVAPDSHSTWTQYFLVTSGEGILHLGDKAFPIAKDSIVEIPKGTRHYVECAADQQIEYFFVNAHDS